MLTSTVLIAAKGLIIKPEYWRQVGFNRDGKRCPVAAVLQVACGDHYSPIHTHDDEPAIVALHAQLTPADINQARRYRITANAGSSGRCWELALWNDCKGRTHDEVIALFDRAIDRVREAEEEDGCAAIA